MKTKPFKVHLSTYREGEDPIGQGLKLMEEARKKHAIEIAKILKPLIREHGVGVIRDAIKIVLKDNTI